MSGQNRYQFQMERCLATPFTYHKNSPTHDYWLTCDVECYTRNWTRYRTCYGNQRSMRCECVKNKRREHLRHKYWLVYRMWDDDYGHGGSWLIGRGRWWRGKIWPYEEGDGEREGGIAWLMWKRLMSWGVRGGLMEGAWEGRRGNE